MADILLLQDKLIVVRAVMTMEYKAAEVHEAEKIGLL